MTVLTPKSGIWPPYSWGKFGPKIQNCLFKGKISTYNQFHDILRLFDVFPNFPFTTSETMRDYHLYTWYVPVARVAERLQT